MGGTSEQLYCQGYFTKQVAHFRSIYLQIKLEAILFENVDEGHTDGEEQVIFHYNHDERIARAPKIVQEYYAGGGPRPVKGLFKVLVSNKGNKFMLASIFILCAFLWVYTFFINKTSAFIAINTASGQVNIPIEPHAFSYDEKIFVDVTFQKSPKLLDGPKDISVTFYCINGDSEECGTDSAGDIYSGSKLSIKHIFTDFDVKRVNCHVQCGDNVSDFTISVRQVEK